MQRRDITLSLLTVGCGLVLHAALTSPVAGGFNWQLSRDIAGVFVKLPGALDGVAVAIDATNESLFGYESSAVDDCTLATDPPPPAVPFDSYRQWAIVADGDRAAMTPERSAKILGQPHCYTTNGVERRIVQGETERRILDIQYAPTGEMTDASLHSN